MKRSLVRAAAALTLMAAGSVPGTFCAAATQSVLTQNQSVRNIVVFDPSVAAADRVSITQNLGATVVRELPIINAVVTEGSQGQVNSMAARLLSAPGVLRVDPDPMINWLKETAPSFAQAPFNSGLLAGIKPFHSIQTAIGALRQVKTSPYLTWGLKRLNVPAAWRKTQGAGVKVCIIDTGIDYNHPDLKDNVKGGWNAVAKSADFMDDNGHGTHVSGTIAAEGKDGNVIGVAPKASLYGVKVLDAAGQGNFDDVIAGMQWAIQNKMDVASMSLGSPTDNPDLAAAVAAMAKSGVVLVAAAGNDGPPAQGAASSVNYPGGDNGAIAVAAMDRNNQAAYFSSAGPQVAVIAPGVDVLSTLPASNNSGGEIPPGGADPEGSCKACTSVGRLDGTSMATPHVSGLAALAIAATGAHGYDAVRAELLKAAAPIKGVDTSVYGVGAVDAAKLVQ